MTFKLDYEHTNCSICASKFSADTDSKDENIRKHLPVLSASSKSCDHSFCHECILKQQAAIAENNGRVPKWIPCMICRTKTAFCPSEPKYHQMLIDILQKARWVDTPSTNGCISIADMMTFAKNCKWGCKDRACTNQFKTSSARSMEDYTTAKMAIITQLNNFKTGSDSYKQQYIMCSNAAGKSYRIRHPQETDVQHIHEASVYRLPITSRDELSTTVCRECFRHYHDRLSTRRWQAIKSSTSTKLQPSFVIMLMLNFDELVKQEVIDLNQHASPDLDPLYKVIEQSNVLKELFLGGNHLTLSNGKLANAVAYNDTIKRLLLNDNNMSIRGIKHLAHALKLNDTLQEIIIIKLKFYS